MCLLAFNWNNHPEYRMILVANRDEFFERPTESLHLWEEGFFAGKDLRAGGTWLGIHPNGRFAAITNFRDMRNLKKYAKSRGDLVKNYLKGEMGPEEYLIEIQKEKDEYEGFNLLVGTHEKLFYFSNRMDGIHKLSYGLYGLSNALLDTPWNKLLMAKEKLKNKIEKGSFDKNELIEAVLSKVVAPDDQLADTGATLEQERAVSAQFINFGDYYGTINTTVILWKHSGEVEIKEKRYFQTEGRSEEKEVQFLMEELPEHKSR
jgi:uncharacterized protein with NRDE domain